MLFKAGFWNSAAGGKVDEGEDEGVEAGVGGFRGGSGYRCRWQDSGGSESRRYGGCQNVGFGGGGESVLGLAPLGGCRVVDLLAFARDMRMLKIIPWMS